MSERASAGARLVAFVALAGFATAHWAQLVEGAPAARLALCALVATLGGLALVAIGRSGLGRLPAGVVAATCVAATAALGLATIGVAPRLLWPAGWGELATGFDSGLAGLAGEIEYPYAEGNDWSRLTILAVAPAALALAAALAFWPAAERMRSRLGLAALVVLVAVYAIAVAVISPGGVLVRGGILLALVGAWLWLPALRWRDALVATGLVAAAGALAVPATAQLSAEPWLDYKSWTLRGVEGTTYSWGHSYGPIDWPRDGTQMLAVDSDEAHYWKTVVLDRFNGVRWTRSDASRDLSAPGRDALPAGFDSRWIKEFAVTIGDLESEVVIGAGTPTRILGIDEVATAPDGTTIALGDPLGKGDEYRVRAYIPDPTAEEMRAVPWSYPRELADHTRIDLPAAPADGNEALPAETVATPLRGDALSPGGALDGPAAKRIARSPYRDVLELARSLTAGQPTPYDAVRAVQDHLRSEYEYSEFPPLRTHPLASFLFEDRRGYCQQFSGAMALMLRMAGIPSRVASGFAPGTRTDDGGAFRVEDFDAHSWVEVYFSGIGWVAFDPTPSSAPVSTQQVPGLPTSEVDRGPAGEGAEIDEDEALALAVPGAGESGGSSSLGRLLAIPGALLLALVGSAALVAARSRRHRRLAPIIAADAQLDELSRALDRLGWRRSEGQTLLELERSLQRSRRRAAARYVGRVRALRYAASSRRPPSLAERRALRRELSSGSGLAKRLRGLLAIPPGGPRIPRSP